MTGFTMLIDDAEDSTMEELLTNWPPDEPTAANPLPSTLKVDITFDKLTVVKHVHTAWSVDSVKATMDIKGEPEEVMLRDDSIVWTGTVDGETIKTFGNPQLVKTISFSLSQSSSQTLPMFELRGCDTFDGKANIPNKFVINSIQRFLLRLGSGRRK